MATVNFLYRSTKSSANLTVRLLYRFNDKDFVIGANTKFEVVKEYWFANHVPDRKTKKIKSSKDAQIMNERIRVSTELNRIENYILKAFNSANPKIISKEWLQNQIDHYYNPNQDVTIPVNLIDYIDFYIDYRKNDIKEASRKKFIVIKHKLERFQAYRKKEILIIDVNDSFKNEFVNYLIKEKYSQNTMQRELVFIKSFCKHARFLGLETSPQLDSLRLEREKVEKIYLSFEELEKIENIEKGKLSDSLENAKDWLIISCYMGQRISDFLNFTKNQVRVENGNHLIEFTQKKTGKNMTIPLLPKVLEILEKRNGDFPYKIADQNYNDFIKLVAEEAGITQIIKGSKKTAFKTGKKIVAKNGKTIDETIIRRENGFFRKCELVTSHIGRRSFATNYYGDVPTPYLISMTGHSSEAMFLNYIGKSNKDLAIGILDFIK